MLKIISSLFLQKIQHLFPEHPKSITTREYAETLHGRIASLGLETHLAVENIDVTDIVHTHGDYQSSLFQILATVGLES